MSRALCGERRRMVGRDCGRRECRRNPDQGDKGPLRRTGREGAGRISRSRNEDAFLHSFGSGRPTRTRDRRTVSFSKRVEVVEGRRSTVGFEEKTGWRGL